MMFPQGSAIGDYRCVTSRQLASPLCVRPYVEQTRLICIKPLMSWNKRRRPGAVRIHLGAEGRGPPSKAICCVLWQFCNSTCINTKDLTWLNCSTLDVSSEMQEAKGSKGFCRCHESSPLHSPQEAMRFFVIGLFCYFISTILVRSPALVSWRLRDSCTTQFCTAILACRLCGSFSTRWGHWWQRTLWHDCWLKRSFEKSPPTTTILNDWVGCSFPLDIALCWHFFR